MPIAQWGIGRKVLTHHCAFLPWRGAQAAMRVRATAISARWTIRQFTAKPVHSSEKGRSCNNNNNNVTRWKKTRVADPDPDAHWIRIQSGQRIRIQVGKNYPQKKTKKFRNFMFSSAGCSLLRAEGFFCNLDVLYRGLGISKLYFFKIKKINYFFQL